MTTIYIINPTATTTYITSTVTPGQVIIPPSFGPGVGEPGTVWGKLKVLEKKKPNKMANHVKYSRLVLLPQRQ